jgi:hypothetical protein
MQKCWTAIAAFKPPLAVALLSAFFFAGDSASSDPRLPVDSEGTTSSANCDPENVVVYHADQAPESEAACASNSEILSQDRDYLIDTATPGSTMVRQGPQLAIGRLHPEFVRRLAAAIREARQAGLASVGIYSAYRPPAFGVGGFSDKFNSLHSYGLAVDMSGIGGPGSTEAKLWYEIAARHGVTCPYGFENRVEWNHCQPTRLKIIVPESPLRDTVTAEGPIDLDSMFEAGNALIESPQSVADAASAGASAAAAPPHADAPDNRRGEEPAVAEGGSGVRRRFGKSNDQARTARNERPAEVPNRCKHPGGEPHNDLCRGPRRVETAARTQAVHSRQASASPPRHHT